MAATHNFTARVRFSRGKAGVFYWSAFQRACDTLVWCALNSQSDFGFLVLYKNAVAIATDQDEFSWIDTTGE
jgi:hypothetical protein